MRNYIESGIPLDAKLTYDLLVSIFQPTSPLHDGAVIIQGDRVAAAACFLPLTINPRLSRELGSRHRAAIGVTEENDAVAIVVSEETGRISIVEDGDLEYDIDSERLRARLQVGGHPSPRPRQAAAGRILLRLMAYHPFRNLGLKFLSTLVAILLWLVVAGERVVERVMRAPVEFQNLPAGLELVGNPPDTVEVRLRGSSGALSRMAAGDMAAVIDLRDGAAGPAAVSHHAEPGQRAVRHRDRAGRAVDVDDGIRDVGDSTVPVEPDIDGRPATGYEVTKVTSDPRDGRSGRAGDGAQAAAGGDHRAGVGRPIRRARSAKW